MDLSLIAIILIAIGTGLLVVSATVRQHRTAELRRHFGAEYDRALRENGPQRVNNVLLARERRVREFRLRDIGAEERETFVSEWRALQSRFVDDPRGAVGRADALTGRLMRLLGYPVASFDQRAADISVAHPGVVKNYRAAHQIALRHRQGQATTEDLRNAVLYYRSLFDELLETESIDRPRQVA